MVRKEPEDLLRMIPIPLDRREAPMELGLHLANFTFTGGPSTLGADVARLARPPTTSASPASR